MICRDLRSIKNKVNNKPRNIKKIAETLNIDCGGCDGTIQNLIVPSSLPGHSGLTGDTKNFLFTSLFTLLVVIVTMLRNNKKHFVNTVDFGDTIVYWVY